MDVVDRIIENPELMDPKLTRKRRDGVVSIDQQYHEEDTGEASCVC
jgi:hypothetical protein